VSGRHSLGLGEDEEVAYGTREDSVRALLPELSTGLGTARGTRLEAALVAATSIFAHEPPRNISSTLAAGIPRCWAISSTFGSRPRSWTSCPWARKTSLMCSVM
jgi:hypothetical protein